MANENHGNGFSDGYAKMVHEFLGIKNAAVASLLGCKCSDMNIEQHQLMTILRNNGATDWKNKSVVVLGAEETKDRMFPTEPWEIEAKKKRESRRSLMPYEWEWLRLSGKTETLLLAARASILGMTYANLTAGQKELADHLASCGNVAVEDGKIVTSLTPDEKRIKAILVKCAAMEARGYTFANK